MALDRFNRRATPLEYEPRPTPSVLRTLELLDPYDRFDVLPTNWLAPLTGLSDKGAEELLCRLDRAGLVQGFTLDGDRNHSEVMKYVRTPEGERYLQKHGGKITRYDRPKSQNLHQIFGCYIQASFELGLAAISGMSLEYPSDILARSETPETTREKKHPFSFYPKGDRLTPDWKPIILRRKDTPGVKLILREDDRDTEGIRNLHIRDKAEAWNAVFKQRLFEKKYGISSALLLFTTVNERHKENIMREWHKVTGKCSWALFKALPEFKRVSATIAPTPTIFDDPWDRIGYSPFSLKTLADA